MESFDNNKQVQYYANGSFSHTADAHSFSDGEKPPKKKFPTWAKVLVIIAAIILGIVLLMVGCSKIMDGIFSDDANAIPTDFGYDYIGALYVIDEMDEYGGGLYDHQYALSAIDAMINDEDNKGLILYIDTPGGSVFATDELYLKIREYQETTGRPVYSSIQSYGTSGGYYISAPCDKIFANRNAFTGSIGVIMGDFIDVSELLDRLGVKSTTITSGPNKSMGSSTEPMSDEQKAILQSLVDESYEQFVGVVAEGRGMSIEEVKKLADGRIYSAKQALDNGLVDEVGTYDEAIADMMESYGLSDCSVEDFRYDAEPELSSLLGMIADKTDSEAVLDADDIRELLALNGSFRLSYMAAVGR